METWTYWFVLGDAGRSTSVRHGWLLEMLVGEIENIFSRSPFDIPAITLRFPHDFPAISAPRSTPRSYAISPRSTSRSTSRSSAITLRSPRNPLRDPLHDSPRSPRLLY